MDSRQQVQSLTEEAICPICQDFFTDPVILECEHNFCRSCITQSWERQEINSCPECRQEFPDRSLRGNRALANLAEKARTLNLNPQEKESKHHCEEHQEELKLFCETDKKLICVICRDSGEHKSHNLIQITEAVGIYKDPVKSSLESLTGKKAAALEMEQQQKQKISKIREESSSLQTHIKSEFTKMHQMLTEKEQSLLRDLREQAENILKPMKRNLRKIQDNLNSLQGKLSTLEKQLERKDRVEFLKEEVSRERRISDNSNELSLTDGALSPEKFNIVLPFPVWNEMLETIKPVSVTLDVETASPQLVVSEDLKSLRLIRTRRSLPDNEKRFSNRGSLCALGSEGFTSGRHYWEVEVGGNQGWSLGVASESVERKRWVSLIPENGFWTMARDEDQFYTNTSPLSPLCVGQIPRMVGVYLSYESGTVSFYNVDTKSHLHTFTGNKFTGKLFPFFEVWGLNKFLRISC
ncbi:zinc-binding protein A33-like isoform X1 [Chiloscyllium plagiosum]|uniref:zinc-binding protein A33-like isoform X1 n=1 Tax=Chiloscyllium plagiosum TaxID=36176 RepID=UPI001CB7FEB2|nr:zinc-binding protein A33-like isoform X1 [Chiloscyllium plagiosum]